MKNLFRLFLLALALSGSLIAQTQFTGDILGSHNMSPSGTSPVQGGSSAACLYCHAPHSGIGGATPLWGQTLSTQTYTLYTSPTIQNTTTSPVLGSQSTLCLSCHDGTVALGSKVPYGNITITGTMYPADVFGSNLGASHPFSLKRPLVDSPNLVPSLAASQTTADPLHKVALIKGTVECTSCHEPHAQNIDPISLNFLVGSNAYGAICLSCHTPNPRTVGGKSNPLSQWTNSAHAASANNVNASAKLGSYATVAQFACLSCHVPHNANGAEGLLRASVPPPVNVDPFTASCMICHNGGNNVDGAVPNIFAEFSKGGHPFPSAAAKHAPGESVILNDNRHATCADCHNAHSSFPVPVFAAPPAIRASQTGVMGATADLTAPNQYDNCFRCHGTSTNKVVMAGAYLPLRAVGPSDRLNIIPQFDSTLSSAHPVTHDGSSYPQPSLRPFMVNVNGLTNSSRPMVAAPGTRIFCTDCHNSDDNREFGGAGPNGPHGSLYKHILERRYEYSQVAPGTSPPLNGPGSPITNILTVNLSASASDGGPYALCGKCHDLSNIMTDAGFAPRAGTQNGGGHAFHINAGFSCSVCHTAHGMGAAPGAISGDRLVNFDINVVGPNNAAGTDHGMIAYTHGQGTNTCTLMCHGYNHNSDGSVTPAVAQ